MKMSWSRAVILSDEQFIQCIERISSNDFHSNKTASGHPISRCTFLN